MLNEITEFKMDKREFFQGEDCWICFDKENYITLTTVNSEKILKNCDTYLDSQITIKSFEKDTAVSCCSYCYESANQLILLEEQIEKLQKEISGFSLLFSKNILQRRSRVENDKIESDNKSTIVVFECVSVKKEVNEHVSNELLSDFEVYDVLVPELLFVTNEHESFMEDNKCEIIIPEEDYIKYSCDAAATNGFETINKISVPKTKNLQYDEKNENTTKTSTADLIKCLKMPIILLERLQPCITRNSSKIVLDNTSCNINTSDNEGNMDIQSVPMNKSVITGKETIKCEKDSDEYKPYQCAICGQGFYKKQDHDKLHNKERSYICTFCNKSFHKRRSLKAHELCHIRKRRLKCGGCSKAFKRASDLKVHETIHSGKYPYKCSLCSKSFRYANSLKRHKMNHSGERPYKCSLCEKSFPCEGDLKIHTKNHSVDRLYKCNLCEKSFKRNGHLIDHKKTHFEEKPHKCALCVKSFRLLSNLREHEKTHSEKRSHKCSFCSKTFKSLGTLKEHIKTHSGERPYKCGFCEKSFARLTKLKEHENIESGEKAFKCSLCNKSCGRKICLTRHVKQQHSSLTSLNCSFCSKSFKNPSKLKSHEISHSKVRAFECSKGEKNLQTNDPKKCSIPTYYDYPSEYIPDPTLLPKNQENSLPTCNIPLNVAVVAGGETVKCENDIDNNKPYKCSICGQGFLQLCDLEDHDALHNKEGITERNLTANEILGETQFICSICSKSFKSALRLKNHKVFHFKNRRFKCSFCDKSFKLSGDAKKHERIHTGERPYKCSFCDKLFNRSSDVKRHEMIHTGERPYKCSFCDKSFNRSSDAKQHETIHTGKRPYKCSLCDKSFSRPSGAKKHEIVHTGKRPYKCSCCEKTFKRKNNLKVHDECEVIQNFVPNFCTKFCTQFCTKKIIGGQSNKTGPVNQSSQNSINRGKPGGQYGQIVKTAYNRHNLAK